MLRNAGWKISTADINLYRGLYSSICQRMASYHCHVLFYSSHGDCGGFCIPGHIQHVIPWPKCLCESSKCSRTNNWGNKNCMLLFPTKCIDSEYTVLNFAVYSSEKNMISVCSDVGCIIYRGEPSYNKLPQISYRCLQIWCS